MEKVWWGFFYTECVEKWFDGLKSWWKYQQMGVWWTWRVIKVEDV